AFSLLEIRRLIRALLRTSRKDPKTDSPLTLHSPEARSYPLPAPRPLSGAPQSRLRFSVLHIPRPQGQLFRSWFYRRSEKRFSLLFHHRSRRSALSSRPRVSRNRLSQAKSALRRGGAAQRQSLGRG